MIVQSWNNSDLILLPPANEVWGKVIFSEASVRNSVWGWWYPSMHCRWYPSMPCSRGVVSQHALQVSRPISRGESEGSGWRGLQAHTQGEGGLQAHTWGAPGPHPGGCIPACSEADTPSPRWLLLWAVRILLECILVNINPVGS